MQNIYRLWMGATVAVMAVCLSSCKKSFLNYTPQGQLSETVVADSAGVAQLLIGAYADLYANYDPGAPWNSSPDNWLYGSGNAIDAHGASFSVTATNSSFDDKWHADYDGVTRCNNTLKAVALARDMSPSAVANTIAQARFLRGYYYFDLKKMFNMVPWIDETTTDFNQPNDKDIWPMIELDFLCGVDSLPPTQPDAGRANSWAAKAFLAKAYLYEHKYTQAKTLFDDIIPNGTTPGGIRYGLSEQFEWNFLPEKEATSPEAVFSINMAANVGNGNISSANQGDMLCFPINSPFGCCGNFDPTLDLGNSYRTDYNGLPYLDTYNQHPLATDLTLLSNQPFTPDTGYLDPRIDWTIGRRGLPFKDWGIEPGANWDLNRTVVGPYHDLKDIYMQATANAYHDGESWAPGSAINYHVIGFNDVLLMAAECEAQVGSLDQAEAYVNMIRNRAANPAGFVFTYADNSNPLAGFTTTPAANYHIGPYPPGAFTSQAYALKAIYFERKLELAMEGHRIFDLVRWGIFSQEQQ
ncbi:MAG TPA: RagB/SusD family nutrient uptake outer membrane protein, partial [Dinghuibacter sp.]|uniref:RagB/SusD family nutrient uptake outer membrane protein n=1 Tax=Dinghuibacter sp. TaxID=2024697 RepID=UPI002C9A3C22